MPRDDRQRMRVMERRWEKEYLGVPWPGYLRSKETRRKISAGHLGKPRPQRARLKMGISFRGKHLPEDHRKRISARYQKIPVAEWREFVSKRPYCYRWTDPELKIRKRVRAFFKGKCVECGKTKEAEGGFLHVHHVSRNKDACCTGETFEWLFVLLCNRHHSVAGASPEIYIPKYKKLIKEQYGGKCYYTLREFNALIEKGLLKSEDWGRKDGR